MRILAIESSCDDLAACLFEGPDKILSNRTASQEALHAPFGGIVPEIASRNHIQQISQLIKRTIQEAPKEKQTIEGIAVTASPGLVGSLLVGVNFAKGFALANNLPIIGVNHLEGHLMSPFLEERKPRFPFLGLVISGGHTNLYYVKEMGKFELLGTTVDDAAGEAYDKVAKLLGLGYPGGPILDKLAKLGDPKKVKFTLPRVKDKKYSTSFSGLKTAVIDYVRKNRLNEILQEKPIIECQRALDLIASFQNTVVTIVEKMFLKAAEDYECDQWAVSGGVACNSAIRERLKKLSEQKKCDLYIPSPKFCTDNAAMIAYVGEYYLSHGVVSDFSLNAKAS